MHLYLEKILFAGKRRKYIKFASEYRLQGFFVNPFDDYFLQLAFQC